MPRDNQPKDGRKTITAYRAPATKERAELGEALREALQQPHDPSDDGSDLPDAPPIPKAGQQVVAIAFKKVSPKTRA